MDSFSYCLEDRGPLLLDDMDFPVNSLERSNNYVKDFTLRGVHDLDKTMLILEGEAVEGTGSVESVFPHMIGDFLLGNPCLGVDNSFVKATSSSLFSSNPYTQELGFGTELSNSCYNSNDMKTTLMNSENLTDSKQGSRLSPEGSNVSSLVEDSLPAKTDFHPQSLHCQVHGCYKDLCSSKDYHKRHKVCDLHSKSAKVVINGIEKRFCQQCSRFHLLKEFDDIKRSCRKRLAGHNERRRRPQFGSQLGSRSGVLEMDLLKSGSFLLIEEEHPAGFYYQEKNVDDKQRKHIKLEKVPVAGKIEHPMQLDDYGCAPSLLSFKSKKSVSNYSSPGNSEAVNPVITANYPDYKTIYKKSSQHSRPRTVSSTEFQEEPMVYDGSTDVKSYGLPRYSESASKYRRSPEEAGSTLDLLQLSSHLQRVEQQQNFGGQIKQENLI